MHDLIWPVTVVIITALICGASCYNGHLMWSSTKAPKP